MTPGDHLKLLIGELTMQLAAANAKIDVLVDELVAARAPAAPQSRHEDAGEAVT